MAHLLISCLQHRTLFCYLLPPCGIKGHLFHVALKTDHVSSNDRKTGMALRIDATDRKILAALQADAAQSLDEIAKAVGSSKTPVWNRIRKLREAGVIGHQTVILDA
ncbi:MAG: AsnC family transcriptional regulator, partial [Roseicyclus sp.]